MKQWILLVILLFTFSGCTFVLPDKQPKIEQSIPVVIEPIIVQGTLVDEYKPQEETLYIKNAKATATNDSIIIDCITTAVAKIDVVVMKGEQTWFTAVGNRWETEHHIVIGAVAEAKNYTLILKAFSKDQVDRTVLSANTGFTSDTLSSTAKYWDGTTWVYPKEIVEQIQNRPPPKYPINNTPVPFYSGSR